MSGKIFYRSSLSDPTKEFVSYRYPFWTTNETKGAVTTQEPDQTSSMLTYQIRLYLNIFKTALLVHFRGLVGRINETA